jgi:hypothetical protein
MDDQQPGNREYDLEKEPPKTWMVRETAAAYEVTPERERFRVVGGREGTSEGRGGSKMKTSVYLERNDVERLGWLSRVEDRPQAEIIRDAIRAYEPRPADRRFALFDSGVGDGRSVADIDDAELMKGFGEDAFGDHDR